MKKNLIIAAMFATVIGLWLASGIIFKAPEPRMATTADSVDQQTSPLVSVRVRQFAAEERQVSRVLRGKTESKRTAQVAAEVAGRVVARPVERGQRVRQGDVLCELAINEREAQVEQTEANLEEAEVEHQGALDLREKGLASEIRIAQTAARLATARADLARAQLALAATSIRAPFDGVVETLPMVVGDWAAVGTPCATLIDLDPILVVANVSERDIKRIDVGNQVTAQTSAGDTLDGTVTFIGSQSDATTRTYPVEITVANADYLVRAGLTTVVNVETDTVLAHRVSSALLTLDDEGVIGLRAVDVEDRVVFHPVAIIEDAIDGAWVTGLPRLVDLITVGHEFVSAGQLVDVVRDAQTGAAASGAY